MKRLLLAVLCVLFFATSVNAEYGKGAYGSYKRFIGNDVTATSLSLGDDQPLNIGAGDDSVFTWETTGNDHLQLGLDVGAASATGHFSIMEKDDMGHANRSPSGAGADPTFRIYSSDETEANDYVDIAHDGTAGYLHTGQGDLRLMAHNPGDINAFRLFDVGDTADGRKWTIHRNAVEGDNSLSFYVDDENSGTIDTTAILMSMTPQEINI